MSSLWITNARVIDPAAQRDATGDLFVRDGLLVDSLGAPEYAKMFDLPVMDHCQDDALTHDAAMNEGVMSMRLGLRGWPHAAEDLIVSRNVILSTYTGAHIHLQHVSSKYSVEIIRRAK